MKVLNFIWILCPSLPHSGVSGSHPVSFEIFSHHPLIHKWVQLPWPCGTFVLIMLVLNHAVREQTVLSCRTMFTVSSSIRYQRHCFMWLCVNTTWVPWYQQHNVSRPYSQSLKLHCSQVSLFIVHAQHEHFTCEMWAPHLCHINPEPYPIIQALTSPDSIAAA